MRAIYNKCIGIAIGLWAVCFSAFAQANQPIKPPPHQVSRFTQHNINHVLWPIIQHYSAYQDIPSWYANSKKPPLPMPKTTHYLGYKLTLKDAIWLALRNNPEVKNIEVGRILDKFALDVAKWQYHPHFTNKFSYNHDFTTGLTTYNASVGATMNTKFGTSFNAGYANTTSGIFDGNNVYTIGVTQPLLRGGWGIAGLDYQDALNTAKIARLNYSQNIADIVVGVIQDYMQLVQAYNDYGLQLKQLKQTKEQLDHDRVKLKAGKIPRSDFLQVEVQYESNKLNIVKQKSTLQTTYQSFLTDMGLVPTAKIQIDKKINTNGYHVPSLKYCINLALAHNTKYLTDIMTLENDKRGLIRAKNKLWPQFDVTAGMGLQYKHKTDNNIGFNISVPLNQMDTRESIMSNRISVEKQKILLQQDRQKVVSDVTTQWKNVHFDLQQMDIAVRSVDMQKQTVKDNALLLKYGRITMYQYQQIRDQLLSQQLGLVGNQISLINAVSTLDNTMGAVLKRWTIKLRY